MPEQITSTPQSNKPSGNVPEENKKSKKWLWILLAFIVVVLVGIGIWLLLRNPPESPSREPGKQATPAAKKETKRERGVAYLKLSGEEDNRGRPLGDLWFYELSSGKKRALTKGGEVGTAGVGAVMKLSPDGKKLAYKKDSGSVQSIWVYDFDTEKEEKLDEFTETVSSEEYQGLVSVVWKADVKALAYLVSNVGGDHRFTRKDTVHVINLKHNEKTTYNLPLPFKASDVGALLAWVGDEIFSWRMHDACGSLNFSSFNISTKTTTDYTSLITSGPCPFMLGSPDSTKISISGADLSKEPLNVNNVKIIDLKDDNKEVLNIDVENPVGVGGWVNDNNSFVYLSKEAGKVKVTLNNFEKKQTKFSLFKPSSSIPDSIYGGVRGFADNNTVVVYRTDTSTKKTSYSILNLEDATETKLPFQTTEWMYTFVLVENL